MGLTPFIMLHAFGRSYVPPPKKPEFSRCRLAARILRLLVLQRPRGRPRAIRAVPTLLASDDAGWTSGSGGPAELVFYYIVRLLPEMPRGTTSPAVVAAGQRTSVLNSHDHRLAV